MPEERVYTISLSKVYEFPRTKRSKKAPSIVKTFVSRHMKTDADNVKLSNVVNALLWRRGLKKTPRRIKVKAIKDKGIVRVYALDEKIKSETKEEKPKEQKKK